MLELNDLVESFKIYILITIIHINNNYLLYLIWTGSIKL